MDWDPVKFSGDLTRPPSVHSLKPDVDIFAAFMMPKYAYTASWPGLRFPTTRVSFGSLSLSQRKRIKYASGKNSDIELMPQPSDDPDDPLNWPRWRKDLNLASLVVMVGVIGLMKAVFLPLNGALTGHFNVSYTWVAALTALPLMLSALTGVVSSIASKFWGKRPIYLASAVLIFAGSVWNMVAGSNFGSCMGARALQGLGWGAFDTLLMETIQDTYFEHERNFRVSIYNFIAVLTTWGSPLLSGVLATYAGAFTLQYRIISALVLSATTLLIFCCPETAFERRSAAAAPTPVSAFTFGRSWRPWWAQDDAKKPSINEFLKKTMPCSFRTDITVQTLFQLPRAFAAPTTFLIFLLTFIPYGALWGLTASLALLVPSSLTLRTSTIGVLFAGPWILATLVVVGVFIYRVLQRDYTQFAYPLIVTGGTLFALLSLILFGLDVSKFWQSNPSEMQLNLPLASFQFGLLAAGAYLLDASTRPLLVRSASFTASSVAVAQRSIGDMHVGVSVLRKLMAAVFVVVVPSAVSATGGLKALALGLGVTQAILTIGIVALWWFYDECVWRLDGKIMGLVDLRFLQPVRMSYV